MGDLSAAAAVAEPISTPKPESPFFYVSAGADFQPQEAFFFRTLTPADVKSCLAVECAFPTHERCNEEKLLYRLTVSPKTCLGLFVLPRRKEDEDALLIAHWIGTRTARSRITDASMGMPAAWTPGSTARALRIDGEVVGHDPEGTTVAAHSLAVLPEWQGKKVGRTLVKMYINYVRERLLGVDGIAIIAHDHLLPFYESVGFRVLGPSACTYGGGGWFDLRIDLR